MPLILNRVIDIAGIHPSLRCSYNGHDVSPGSFEELARSFLAITHGKNDVPPHVFFKSERWQVVIAKAGSGSVGNASYVNGVWTSRGGAHVTHITDQVVEAVHAQCMVVDKELAKGISQALIRGHVWVAVSAMIENPSFDSQAKESLVSPEESFGSKMILTAKQIDEILSVTGIVEQVLEGAESKQLKELDKNIAKKVGPKKNQKLLINKLEDANLAGSDRASECTLILTEGDSAKALAVAGIVEVGRDTYGVFPLKGKFLNVRDATHSQLKGNAELKAIKDILGLKHEKTYATPQSGDGLRYGRVMLMTDQDHDGSHIKGLIFNMLHHFWPKLVQRNGFVVEFVTPIVKAFPNKGRDGTKSTGIKSFYSSKDFNAWCASLSPDELKKWKINYYKGLGTNTSEEGRQYFAKLNKHEIKLVWKGEEDGDALLLAFGKENADMRKKWLSDNPADTTPSVDHSVQTLLYRDFVNKELIQYSHAANVRSIPSMLDGCKPTQRKVLYSCFKRTDNSEMKVAALGGIVSVETAYHHGEESLHQTMIKMAQNFVGANNLPLLYAGGQFGTRLKGGDDAASPRYISTRLMPFSRLVYRPEDDAVLTLKEEDGQFVEPRTFVPIVPMVLVNGASGIGTGWSTSIPQHCPIEVINAVSAALKGMTEDQLPRIDPWYAGFTGTIEYQKSKRAGVEIEYVTSGYHAH